MPIFVRHGHLLDNLFDFVFCIFGIMSLYMGRIWAARGWRWWIAFFVLKKRKIHHFCTDWVSNQRPTTTTYNLLEFMWATRPFKVLWYLFIFPMLYPHAFLFTFAIYALLIYFMHEYILEKFILCIYIWNQMHNIMF